MLEPSFDNCPDGTAVEQIQTTQDKVAPPTVAEEQSYAAQVDWDCQDGVCVLRWKPRDLGETIRKA